MKILITGGAGFIGTHLRRKLTGEGHFVRIIDNLSPQVHGENPRYSFSECEFIKGDVCDARATAEAVKGIDIIYHLAAETGVGQSQYEIGRYVATNTLGTAIVFQAAAQSNVKQVILSSSRAVYGEGLHICSECGKEYVPLPREKEKLDAGDWEIYCSDCGALTTAQLMKETDPAQPTSIYGLTKLQQEEIAKQVSQIYDLPVTILRLFNVYGPGQSLTNPYVGVLGTFFRQIMAGKSIDIYEDGRMRRDFVFIDDVINALTIVSDDEASFNRTVNVGSGTHVTLEEAGRKIFEVLKTPPQIKLSGKYRLGDIHHAVADTLFLQEKLNYRAQTDFQTGLNKYLEWAYENDKDFSENGKILSDIDAVAERELAERNLLRQAKK